MLLYGALGAVAVIVVFFIVSKKRNDVEVVHLVPPDETGPAVPPRLAANKQPIVSPPPSPVGTPSVEPERPRPVNLDAAIQQALRAGNKIDAIKYYREKTGLGLKEAKDAIEALLRGAAPPPLPAVRSPPANVDAAIAQALRKGNKIEAIKLYREKTGLGLKEAKDAIDAMASGSPPPLPPRAEPVDDDMVDAIDAALRADQLIQAIKLYRERTGLGLADAKRAVEARRAHLLGQR